MAQNVGEPVRTGLGREGLEQLARLLKPLSNVRRLELLLYLREPRYLEEVASHAKVTRQAASEHLEALESIGLVQRRASVRPGKRVVEYVLVPEALYDTHEFFEELVVQVGPWAGRALETRGPNGPGAPPAAEPAMPAFVVVHGLHLGRQFPLPRRSGQHAYVIGRSERCDVPLGHDAYASGRHAEVRPVAPGSYALVDLHSRNGTLLNWRLVPPGESRPIRHGDLVGAGRTLLLFVTDAGRPPPNPSARVA